MLALYNYTSEYVSRELADFLKGKLDVKEVKGLQLTYKVIPPTKLSPDANADVKAYASLRRDVGNFLNKTLGNKPLTEQKFKSVIQEHMILKYTDLSLSRRLGLANDFTEFYMNQFTVK